MTTTVSIAGLFARGVVLDPHEAVAIAQQLISTPPSLEVTPPLGPPSIDNVVLSRDGSVRCTGCASTLAVSEIGVLLDVLLPRDGRARVPGGVRYAIARALLEVDVPPFDSPADLSATLRRHENGERREVVSGVIRRYESASSTSAEPFVTVRVTVPETRLGQPMDRRRAMPSASELRRHLREADRARFETTWARETTDRAPAQPRRPPPPRSSTRRAITAVGLVALSFGSSYVGTREVRTRRAAARTPGASDVGRIEPAGTASATDIRLPAESVHGAMVIRARPRSARRTPYGKGRSVGGDSRSDVSFPSASRLVRTSGGYRPDVSRKVRRPVWHLGDGSVIRRLAETISPDGIRIAASELRNSLRSTVQHL